MSFSLEFRIRGFLSLLVQGFDDQSGKGEMIIEGQIIPFALVKTWQGSMANFQGEPLWIGINYPREDKQSDYENISITAECFMGTIGLEREMLKVFIAAFCMAALQ